MLETLWGYSGWCTDNFYQDQGSKKIQTKDGTEDVDELVI